MNNLRITPKRQYVDSYGTGDSHSYNVYEVRMDIPQEELKRYNYSPDVIQKGRVIETFNSETNAEIFLTALKNTIK